MADSNPIKLCECGCGQPTTISTKNDRRQNAVKGVAARFIKGHNTKLLIKITHGKSDTRLYKRWYGMIQRCSNPHTNSWALYGGRGIRVCDRWMSFEAFYEDMGECPAGCSIDRYPNQNGNYEPGNCRWATSHEQTRNNNRNVWLTFGGKTLVLRDWSKELGINYATLRHRVRTGWSTEKILTEPVSKAHSRRGGGAWPSDRAGARTEFPESD